MNSQVLGGSPRKRHENETLRSPGTLPPLARNAARKGDAMHIAINVELDYDFPAPADVLLAV